MNNEPVAWMYAVNGIWTAFSDELPPDDAYDEGTLTPLYTHPHSEESVKVKELGNPVAWRSQDPDGYWSVYQAPVENSEPLYTGFKELTDEEIADMVCSGEYWELSEGQVIIAVHFDKFARAILRKAQE